MSSTRRASIPFYPSAEHEVKLQVDVWWFERNFSQGRYGPDNRGSNACTLIALLCARKCAAGCIKMYADCNLNPVLVLALAEAILEGNDIHRDLLTSGAITHVNLTIPEALEGAADSLVGLTEWKSLIYLLDLGDTLYDQMKAGLRSWWGTSLGRTLDYVFVVLICDNRSILFVFQRTLEKATLIDSHRHLDHGCVIAQVPIMNLHHLCFWHKNMLKHCYGSKPDCYELSFLYMKPGKCGKGSSRIGGAFKHHSDARGGGGGGGCGGGSSGGVGGHKLIHHSQLNHKYKFRKKYKLR